MQTMKTAFVILAVLATACSEKKPKAPADPTPWLQQIKSFADRACACGDAKDCVTPIRDEYDQVKFDLLKVGDSLTGDAKTAFDADHKRLKLCGDGAGLTFWDH